MTAFDEALFETSLCIEAGEWSKEILSNLPSCKAVLLLTDARDRPIQLLQAANLRRTAQARLIRDRADTARRRADISESATTLFYIRCRNNFESQLTYTLAAHAVFQETAADWIRLPKLSLAAIETDACLPFFHITENPQQNVTRRVFGLFPARKAAVRFCNILNTVFGLCRNPVPAQHRERTKLPLSANGNVSRALFGQRTASCVCRWGSGGLCRRRRTN